ncbi:MAG: FtsH protease activity modulator HflK [Pseudomonadota bacterium]|nr:FtsH protease activity modulator HflK [Pseudomonadota bacterium]
MPQNNNSGGPWGTGGKNGGDKKSPWGGGQDNGNADKGSNQPGNSVPEIDEIVRKGQQKLRSIMGGKAGGGGSNGTIPGGENRSFGRAPISLIVIVLVVLWGYASLYTVKPEERSIELFLGSYYKTGESGLNFAPWPVVRAEVLTTTRENTEEIGVGIRGGRADDGLMLTGDENIVDIDFQVVWNISNPSKFLFNLADPRETIQAVSESAMREVIGRSELSPILNRDRALVSSEVRTLIQNTLDSYDSGVNIVRLNFDKADPPAEVIDAFRDVQAAEQERDTLEKQADAYANKALAQARGEAAQLLEEAEGYRAKVVNEASGEASRFLSIYNEYKKAKDVTRKRLYLDTMERMLGRVDKVILDKDSSGGQGVVPYLPLNQLKVGGSS